MDVGIGADTLIELYGTEHSSTVERMLVLREHGTVLPCLTTYRDPIPQAAAIHKLELVASQRNPLKVSMEDGSSFICGYDLQVMDITGTAVSIREAVGIPLRRGNERSVFRKTPSPVVRSIIPIPVGMDLGVVRLHGHSCMVLANGLVTYT